MYPVENDNRSEQTPKGRPYYTDKCYGEGIIKTVPKRVFEKLLLSGLIKRDKEVERFHPKKLFYVPRDRDTKAAVRERYEALRERRKASAT